MRKMRHRFGAIMLAVAVVAMVVVPPFVEGWATAIALAQPASSPEVETTDAPEVTDPPVDEVPMATDDATMGAETPVEVMTEAPGNALPTSEPDAIASSTAVPTGASTVFSGADAMTLLIDGVASSKTVPVGTTVQVTISPPVAVMSYWYASSCDGDPYASMMISQLPFVMNSPASISIQATFPDGQIEPSPCLTVTWDSTAPTHIPDAINLLLDQEAVSKQVALGTTVMLTTNPSGMAINVWSGSACAGDPANTVPDKSPAQSFSPLVASFQAFDPANPAAVSPCRTIIWAEPIPTISTTVTPGIVSLFVDGSPSSKSVPVGTEVTFSTNPASLPIRGWAGSACGIASSGQTLPDVWVRADFVTTYSFQAFDPGKPWDVSNCVTISWFQPPTSTPTSTPTITPTATVTRTPTLTPTPTPTLGIAIDGVSESKTVPAGTTVSISVPPSGGWLHRWLNGSCSGPATTALLALTPFTISSNVAATESYQSFDSYDGSRTSVCLTVTWLAPPTATVTPTPGPIDLLLDGVAASKTVPVAAGVRLTTSPSRMWINMWSGVSCSGNSSSATDGYEVRAYVATTMSFRAFNPDDPSQTSACYTITWVAPTPTATSTPRVPAFTVSCGSYASDRELNLSYTVDLGDYPQIAWSLVPENDQGQADLAFAPQSVGSATGSPLSGTMRYTANQTIDWHPNWYFRLTINGASSIRQYVSCSPTTLPSPTVTATATVTITSTSTEPQTPTATNVPTNTATSAATATPSGPPPLTLNGGTTSLTVPLGTTVNVLTDPNALFNAWIGASCSQYGAGVSQTYYSAVTRTTPQSMAFRAFWPGVTGNTSACLTVTWQDPPTTTATATATTAPTETLASTETATATSVSTETPTFTATVTSTPPETATSTATATTTATPSDPPGFTLNGERTSIVVDVLERVSVVPDAGTFISRYLTADCSGEDYGPIEESYRFSLDEPTVRSFRGYLADNPMQQTGCLTVTSVWPATETATATVTATRTSTSVPPMTSTPTATTTPTETPIATATTTATSTTIPTETPMETLTATDAPSPTPTETATATATATATTAIATSTETATPAATSTLPVSSGSVIVRIETTDGSDLPDGLRACVAGDCLPVGALASVHMMALALPSGAGIAFVDVPVGIHVVTLQDAANAELDAQEVSVVQGEASEVTFVLGSRSVSTATVVPPTADPGATSMAVSGLPKTGLGHGAGTLVPLLLLIFSALTGMAAYWIWRERPARP